jgi:conjugative transposon TraN protein
LLGAQETASGLELLTVNDQVTTVITATEPIRFVDISTGKVAGDQPLSNTLRLKPKEGADVNADGDVLAIVTVITERYRVQYGLIYTTRMNEAVTEKTILQTEVLPYNNPAVSMSTEEMARFARRVWDSPAKYRNVGARKHHMNIRLNNIYSAGEYFFIDFSIENRTNIRFDIDQIRVKVEDKRQARAANCQSIEITPALILENSSAFLHGYRNVLVLKKLTFPNDKVLTIEMSEKQISGRTITLSIDYEDVLYADSFSETLLRED